MLNISILIIDYLTKKSSVIFVGNNFGEEQVKNSVVFFALCNVILSASEVSSDAKHHIVSCETIGFFGYASE